MADLIDILLVGAGSYYIVSKVNEDNDESFQRLLMGAAAGIPAAMKGPEAIDAVKNYVSSERTAQSKDRLTGALVGGTLGYVLGDRVLSSDNNYDVRRV